ncbi:MAG: tRNA lysidine(34) synthetase TilS [Verrucomicrobiota bacterium]
MIDLAERVAERVADQGLLDSGEPLLVAVSGGVDSIVLLRILHQVFKDRPRLLALAHFNHQLRGRRSDADESFVRRVGAELGLRVVVGRGEVRRTATRLGISLEMAARRQRHRFLAQTAVKLGMRVIALGHHANDQVELFFLRLLRGAGPEGLAGMREASPSPADSRVTLIRPLLAVWRTEIEAYAREHKIQFRQDETNTNVDFERNRVRHQLLPFLQKHFPRGVDAIISRLMAVLGAESDYLASQTREIVAQQRETFGELPVAIQRRWLREECFRLGIEPNWRLIDDLRGSPARRHMVEGGRVAWVDRSGRLHLEWPAKGEGFNSERRQVRVSRPGEVRFGDVVVSWRRTPRPDWNWRKPPAGMERFDWEKVGSVVRLRHWQPGDRFQPIGMAGAVKVQDLLTNQKIPVRQRRGLVVAETLAGQIIWIEGLRISESFKIDAQTGECLEWRWERKGKDQKAG